MENEFCVEIINEHDDDNNREGNGGDEENLAAGIVRSRVLPERTVVGIISFVVRAHDEAFCFGRTRDRKWLL